MTTDRILDLRSVFGVLAQVTRSSAATGGEFVEMVCTADPGSGTMVHYHPGQEETFHVLEGTMEVLRNGVWESVQAGDTYLVPRGEVHAWRNRGNIPVRFQNVHRPALGFQDHMESLDRLTRAGKIRATKDWRSLVYMSMSAVKYKPDVTVKPPQWIVNAMAFVGQRLGFTLSGDRNY
jgi:mannose-6-phosphate isomerase-like protein (cupin superfamily)